MFTTFSPSSQVVMLKHTKCPSHKRSHLTDVLFVVSVVKLFRLCDLLVLWRSLGFVGLMVI